MLPRSFSHSFDLSLGVLDFLTAGAAGGAQEILGLIAARILTSNHQEPATGIAFFATHKGGPATDWANSSEWFTTSGANEVTTFYLFEAMGAMIAKG